jgi:hypothetical protein
MIFDKLVILVGWLYWWSAPTLVGEHSWSLNKVGRGTGTLCKKFCFTTLFNDFTFKIKP